MSVASSLGRGLLNLFGRMSDDGIRKGGRAVFGPSWRRFERAIDLPRPTQIGRLLTITSAARDTEFGKAHGFADVHDYDTYRSRVPVRGYEEFRPYVARMLRGEPGVLTPDTPHFFARTSGTTGDPKHVPVTRAYVQEYRRPRRVWARQVIQTFPGLIRGRVLTMSSPALDARAESGTPIGSVSVGLTRLRNVDRARYHRGPLDAAPECTFLIDDFDLKYYALLRLAAQEPITLASTINPSTLLLFAQILHNRADDLARDLENGTLAGIESMAAPIAAAIKSRLRRDTNAAARLKQARADDDPAIARRLWPTLQGLTCWKGGAASFYLPRLAQHYPELPIMDYGYIATEGGFTIPLSPEGAAGVVSVLGHFLEFVPEGAAEQGDFTGGRLADDLEVGARYRVLVTGSHGLYRYDINDVVECVGHLGKTAELVFVHKGGNMLSVTGEKIGEAHVVEANLAAERETTLSVRGAVLTCVFDDPPYYLLGVEPARDWSTAEVKVFTAAFEKALAGCNVEYAAKRESQRLDPLQIRLLKVGAFAEHRSRSIAGGALDGQYKPPRLARDPGLLDALGARGPQVDRS